MLVEMLSAIAEPTRLGAIRLLWDGGEHCVCELMAKLEASQSRMSRHMQILKAAGLVADRRDAQWVRYRLNPALDPDRKADSQGRNFRGRDRRKGRRMSIASDTPSRHGLPGWVWSAAVVAAAVAWWVVYRRLPAASEWIVAHLPVERASHTGEALAFFFYDVPKVMMLLDLIVFAMGVVRSFFSPGKDPGPALGHAEKAWANVMAAGLGVLTPFCSCSAVPLFIGFVSAGVPLGVTFSFLIAAPMVNEVALILLIGLVGWQVAAIYLGFGLAIAIVAGLGDRQAASRRLAAGLGARHPFRRQYCRRPGRRTARTWPTVTGLARGRARDLRQGLGLDHPRHRHGRPDPRLRAART